MSRAQRRKAKVEIGEDGDTLRLTLTPHYLHLKVTSPGSQKYYQEIYVPRRSLLHVLRWVVRASRSVPRDGRHSVYPPDALRVQFRLDEQIAAQKRELKKAATEEARRMRQKRRHSAAKRRGRQR